MHQLNAYQESNHANEGTNHQTCKDKLLDKKHVDDTDGRYMLVWNQ